MRARSTMPVVAASEDRAEAKAGEPDQRASAARPGDGRRNGRRPIRLLSMRIRPTRAAAVTAAAVAR